MKQKFKSEDRCRIVVEYASGKQTIESICTKYNITKRTLDRWRRDYMRKEVRLTGASIDAEIEEYRAMFRDMAKTLPLPKDFYDIDGNPVIIKRLLIERLDTYIENALMKM